MENNIHSSIQKDAKVKVQGTFSWLEMWGTVRLTAMMDWVLWSSADNELSDWYEK